MVNQKQAKSLEDTFAGNSNMTEIMRTHSKLAELRQKKVARKHELYVETETVCVDIGSIFESITDALVAVDSQWCYIYVNSEAARLMQKNSEDLLGKEMWEVFPDTIGTKFEKEYKRSLIEQVVVNFEEFFPSYSMWLEVRANPFEQGLAIYFRDISQRKKDEQEYRQLLQRERAARAEAESANRIKDEFLAVLSHELRSPLNPILGWAKMLRTGKYDQVATHRALETIERNAKLQAQLIEDLLDVSRILRGKLVLNIYPVNLVTTIEAAIETVQLAAQAKAIQVHTFLDSNVGLISGDTNRLQQILWNLLSNAIKFTPNGGRVEVRLERVEEDKGEILNGSSLSSGYAQITITDNGKGINAEFLPHVFEYFRQENSSTTRKFGGLGLGLAIVRYLTEMHGGSVTAHSQGEGLGATFTVKLPLVSDSQYQPVDSEDFHSLHATLHSPLEGLRILVVDDEADIRELVAFILEEFGAEVCITKSASEALTVIEQSVPDLLVCDIGMPDVDGYMLMRQIRALPSEKGGQMLAVALTAYAGEYNQKQALASGFQMHLSKPVEPDKLVREISRICCPANTTEKFS
ncbi:hybrid sensor histidine kinase/response regulator [Scytonema hofmannii PCC 7110]|uniref:Circadian input-output histidine kinase CikA n=1 Tax=Scytonema hofmannii PCC 7110 TaxID=128403 RepID=A0A139XBD7_9CYAN|nr:PAS domain-containing sensor histidine kinase [Scytonema hofmannii]KYC41966.1 hybrid sensor histidine kinase/response regulator [Scytonema hofmannii PCC 7110]